jgi:hypothetical protein
LDRRFACVIALAGCGRIAFDPRTDAAAPVRCDWSHGAPALATTPMLVTSLTSGTGESDPFLVPGDPHTMYFTSGRTGAGDIYVAHRAALDLDWDPPAPVAELDTSTLVESSLVVDAGALDGYYDVLDGAAGTAKLYELARATTSDPYQVVRELTELDTHAVQYDPFPSAGEHALYFTAGTVANDLELYIASRATEDATWGDVQLAPYSTPGASQQTLTADRLAVLWSAENLDSFDLFYAVRQTVNDPFGPPSVLAVSSTTNNDYEPYIRDDGCELHWTSGPGFAGTGGIYEVMFAP